MNSLSTILFILLVLLLGLTGYLYLDKVSPLQFRLKDSQQEKEDLSFYVEQLEQRNSALAKQLEQKMREFSEETNQEISQLKSTYEELISGLEKEVQAGEINITQLADQLKVEIIDHIIFPSGEAEISDHGTRVLRQVGEILKQEAGRRIKVEGHTDNVPIHPNLERKFASNWELSVARATNVVRFLSEEVNLDARNLEASGFGEYRPVATNKTRGGRAKNRRIEIRLFPQSEDIVTIVRKGPK